MNIREETARYYDYQNNAMDDIPFYRARIPSRQARILELGCGTGRVLLPLAHECSYIHGLDASPAMLDICRAKINTAGLPLGRTRITEGDITDFDLGEHFDLIIAPFRVMQNLETDAEVGGMMRGITRHLAPSGTAILNTFMPNRPLEELRRRWSSPEEHLVGETVLPNGDRLVRLDRRPRLQEDPLVLFPELIYRRFAPSGELLDEAVTKIAMRCWYPPALEKLVRDSGFEVTGRWGGYDGEEWGAGNELVIEFKPPRT